MLTAPVQSLSDVLKLYKADLQPNRWKVREFNISINTFAKSLGYPPTTWDLTNEKVAAFSEWLYLSGAGPQTACNRCGMICLLWRYAHENHYVSDLPGSSKPASVS